MFKSVSLLLLLGFIWGSGYSLARYVTIHGVSPIGYAFWQALGPAVFLSIIVLCRKTSLGVVKQYWYFFLITGVLGILIPNTNMYFAASHLTAGTLAIIVNTVPLIVYPLALLFRQERFHPLRLLGVICGVVGIAWIVVSNAQIHQIHINPWAYLALMTPLAFALCAIYITKKRPAQCDSLILSAGMLLIATILLIPIVFSSHAFHPLTFPFTRVDYAICLEIILSSVGYIILFELLKTAGSVFYSLVGGVVMLTGIFWGGVFFNEQLHLWVIIAIMLILSGISLVTIFGLQKETV